MISQLDNSRYARSILSNSARREVLWNVLEPGDPYDIKKSMIAKLPGDKKLFMGEHIELVCLLQAAQIERLCQFLDDYKLKFREIERSVLDRHSYEVQIKELTQKLTDQEALRNETNKLRQFIKRQTNEIEMLQKNTRDNRQNEEGYKNVYEKSLERVNQLLLENKDLRQLNQDYRVQLQTAIARLEALEKAKNRQIEDLKFNFAQYSKESYESSLNSLRQKYEGELKRAEYELKRQKEFIDAKNMEINEIYRRNDELTNLLNELKGKGDQHYILERQVADYENKFVVFGQQIQRLNITLRDYISKLQQSELKRRQLQRRIEKYEFEMREVQSKARSAANEIGHLKEVIKRFEVSNKKIEESQLFIIQYEAKINELARDNEQLNTKLRFEADNTRKLREELARLTYENSRVKLLQKQNNELKEGGLQINILRRNIAELQNQVAIFNQQLDRLAALLKVKDAEIQKLRAVAFESESLRAKIKQTEYSIRNQYESELVRIKNDYESKYQTLRRNQGNEYQSKTQVLQNERDRLRDLLRQRNEEAERQRNRIYELQAQINRTQVQTSVKIKNYDVAIAAMKRQNEELYAKFKQLSDNERLLFQFQNKLSQYERQLQRLTSLLKNREEEIITLRTKLKQSEGQNLRLETDVGRKLTGYQQNINQIRTENQELKKTLKDLINESNQKLTQASQEIQRLGLNIRTKQDEKNQLEAKIRQLTQQIQIAKQYSQRVAAENEDLRKRLGEADIKINSLINDSSSNIRTVSTENEALKRQLNEMKTAVAAYEAEVTKRMTIYEQNIAKIGRQNQELKRVITQYETRLNRFAQQNQKLNVNLKQALQDNDNLRRQINQTQTKIGSFQIDIKKTLTTYETNIQNLTIQRDQFQRRLSESDLLIQQRTQELRILAKQNENLKRQFKQYEFSVTQKLQGDVARKYALYEQTIAKLNQQNDQLRKKIQELGGDMGRKLTESESKLALLTQQYERIKTNLNFATQQNQALKKRLEDYNKAKTHLGQYEVSIKRLYTEFERLQGIINQLQKERQSLIDKNHVLDLEIQRLTQQNKDLQQQTKDIRLRLVDENALQKRISEQLGVMVILFAQIQTLRQRVKDKEKEVEVVRRSSLAPNIV